MARIIVITPDGQSRPYDLQPRQKLGRHPDNQVQVLDRIASKEHCEIFREGETFSIRDLGSLNGTFVNGERIQQRALHSGDEIMVGSTRIVFEQPEVSVPQAPSAGLPGPAPGEPPAGRTNRVTIAAGMVESHIRTKLQQQTDQSFLPEQLIQESDALRQDYERLRVSYELTRAIGAELDVDRLLAKILDCAFTLLKADRGVVLLCDADGELQPRCVRTKGKGIGAEEVTLSTTIINSVVRERAAILSSDASMDARFKGAHSIIMQGIRSSMAVPLVHSEALLGVMVLDSQVATNAFTQKDLQLTQTLANQAAIAIQNSLYAAKIEQEALTRERLQRLLSPAIAEQVISGKVDVAKGGQVRDTTVFFSDIRGFTSMSESRSAQDIVNMLNEYFELMVEVIFKYEGTLDKFVGDEIMALFGSPVHHPDDAVRAVRTAVEQMRVLAEFNNTRLAEGEDPVRIGIGINSGEVVAGYLGSSKALDYTVIGDVVNTAARLCSYAKAGEIIISDSTYHRVKDHFEVERLPPAQVKGKSKALEIYRVLGEKGAIHLFGSERTRPA
jgi:adenylate cyclase